MFARGYFPGRSGQVFLVPREGDFVVDPNPLYAFMHGSGWSYDTHIPLLLYGAPFIRQGEWRDPVVQQDVVPTLAALLGIPPPATATGRVLQQALNAGAGRPRVMALIVMDGTRADYLDTYSDVMPTLTRLRREGAWFAEARVNYMPTLTSVGHATLGTGADPRIHGLVVNNLFNRVTGKLQESYDGLDPGELMALTLADIWNIATDGRAVIVGQGGAIRATAGPRRPRRLPDQRTESHRRQLQHQGRGLGNESGLLHDVRCAEAPQRPPLLGRRGRNVDGT